MIKGWKERSMTVISKVVCPVCGCCCDDIELIVKDNRIIEARNACAMSAAKFEKFSLHRNTDVYIRKNGELTKASIEEAIRKSAEILTEASYPILYGWSSTSCEAIKVGLELAEEVGGIIDNTSTVCHGPSILAAQDVGLVGATLGQIRHRADLIVYWGSNPWSAHPRHMERYTALSDGRFQMSIWRRILSRIRSGSVRKRVARIVSIFFKHREKYLLRESKEKLEMFPSEERKLIVVDVRRTRSADLADYFVQVKPGGDYEVLQALRALIRDEELEVDEVAGVPLETLEEIADAMVNCKFGVIFFGLGLTMSKGKLRNVEVAIKLTQDLNQFTKFLIIPMRGHFNVTGANTVFTWQTGYPYAVDFSQGYPRYNPGETSVIDVLRRGDADAALVIASDPISNFPREAARNLMDIPSIVIDPHISLTALVADVVIPSAFVGIEAEGTVYRMDHVPLPLKKVVEPPPDILTDEEILRRILEEVRSLKGA
ncbi:formylmethanofuran dehydrogenase subunit B [Candidatus Bathyarchaeota archaeon]|nr:MAG: formylmethanofuran dehydrogenase subunit B [Candidatus Bathyarchaeota archaeon]